LAWRGSSSKTVSTPASSDDHSRQGGLAGQRKVVAAYGRSDKIRLRKLTAQQQVLSGGECFGAKRWETGHLTLPYRFYSGPPDCVKKI
jgi:hypothetical protein